MKKALIFDVIVLAIILIAIVPAMPVARAPSETGGAYIVVFDAEELPSDAETIVEESRGRVVSKYPNIGVLTALPLGDSVEFENLLGQQAEIAMFGHDFCFELPQDFVVLADDELYELEDEDGPVVTDPGYWTYQWYLWHTIEASPDKAWTITTGSPDIKVAVMDTGVDYNHPDLAPNYDFELSRSFIDWDSDGVIDEDEMDYYGHGTFCAGILAAAINGEGAVGVAPTVTLVNLKAGTVDPETGELIGYASWLFDAAYYAVENGINVVSMSFGEYVSLDNPDGVALYEAGNRLFSYARRNGVVCVAAAGNEATDMTELREEQNVVLLPSQLVGVISVIGTDIYDGLASFSNYGSILHGMSAPAGDFAFEEPEWYEPVIPPEYWQPLYGAMFSTACPQSFLTPGQSYFWAGGTSAAAPQVAGVAGLLLSVNPELKPSQVWHYLRKGAEDIGKRGYDEYFNFGLLNAYNSLRIMMLKGKGAGKHARAV